MKIYIIGVSGPSCGGKTTTCEKIVERINDLLGMNEGNVVVLSQDRYYIGGDENTNFDDPKQLEFDLMLEHLSQLKQGNSIDAPIYDFTCHKRLNKTTKIGPAKIVLVEGILIFTNLKILQVCDTKLFVTAHPELCYERRLKRDISERGRNELEVKTRYFRDVLPSTQYYVTPKMTSCDIVIMNNTDGKFVGLNILLDHIENQIKKLSF